MEKDTLEYDNAKEINLKESIMPFIEPELIDDFRKLTLLGIFVKINGIRYEIIDWNFRARGYPIIYKKLSDNSKYKCSGSFMAKYINDSLKLANKKAKEILARAI